MWICKKCGCEAFYIDGIMNYPNMDKKGAIQNYSDFEPCVYVCLKCETEANTIQELADWANSDSEASK